MTDTIQERAGTLVSNEVHCNASAVITHLQRAHGEFSDSLCFRPTTDDEYREAAQGDNWKTVRGYLQNAAISSDLSNVVACAQVRAYFDDDMAGIDHPENVTAFVQVSACGQSIEDNLDAPADWEDVCRYAGCEPEPVDVLEYWVVSQWLADKLEEVGECIERDFHGLIIWGLTTSGQAISMDNEIQQIVEETQYAFNT